MLLGANICGRVGVWRSKHKGGAGQHCVYKVPPPDIVLLVFLFLFLFFNFWSAGVAFLLISALSQSASSFLGTGRRVRDSIWLKLLFHSFATQSSILSMNHSLKWTTTVLQCSFIQLRVGLVYMEEIG